MGVDAFKYGSNFSSEFVSLLEPTGEPLSDGSVAPGLYDYRKGWLRTAAAMRILAGERFSAYPCIEPESSPYGEKVGFFLLKPLVFL